MTHQPREQPQPAPAPRHHPPRRSRSAARRAGTVPGRLLPALAATLALAVTSGTALTASAIGQPNGHGGWSPTDSAGRHARFVDRHGLVLPTPQLYLIYWGSLWRPYTAAEPTAAQVSGAVRTLFDSAYLAGLTQYRGSGHGTLRGSNVITSSDPPDGFTDEQIAAFVDAQITKGTVPGPDPDNQTLYGVVLPTGVTTGSATWGKHNYFEWSGKRLHYAWFTNVGGLDSITRIVSHELVEAATDPQGGGFLGVNGTCDEQGWCEIADVCEGLLSMLDGVTVQAYWSNQDHGCIAPGSAPEPPLEATRSTWRSPASAAPAGWEPATHQAPDIGTDDQADTTRRAPTNQAGSADPFEEDTMSNNNELEDVLAWGRGEDPAVHHLARTKDLTLRIVTSLAVASVVVFVAIGGVNHPPSPANDTRGGDPRAGVGQPTPNLFGPVLQPSCLEVWPGHRHVPCPWPPPKTVPSVEPECFYPHRICPPPTP